MKRPIIFVAHSLGGIIVKGALIYSDAARKGALKEYRSIKTLTYGIMFMGTPYQGGNGVQFRKLLVNAASVYKATNSRLLEHLERDSEWLQQQLRQYGPNSREFMTKFAYEQYETPTALGHSIMVVPKASAVVPGSADAEQIMIHADHKEMVKFESNEDNDYENVSDHLIIMVEGAHLTYTTFSYKPLDRSRNEIRLLNIMAPKKTESESEPLIECSLRTVSLDNNPDYSALSYAWGDNRQTNRILIDGCVHNVTDNLNLALQHLRNMASDSALFWIDSLCINQQDDMEKSWQVQQMINIYRQATKVVVWLGPTGDESDQAMDWLDRRGREFHVDALDPEHMELYFRSLVEDWSSGDLPLDALVKLINRAWWSRIWIIQEIAVATTLLFVCGERIVSGQYFYAGWTVLRAFALFGQTSLHGYAGTDQDRNSLSLRLFIEQFVVSPVVFVAMDPENTFTPFNKSFMGLRNQAFDMQSSDPRDQVYALLGLINNADTLEIRPDYSISCADLYNRVASNHLLRGDTSVLSLCGFPKTKQGLASWAPDWSIPLGPKYRRTFPHVARPDDVPFYASKGSRASMTVHERYQASPMLKSPGIHVGSVHSITTALEPLAQGTLLSLRELGPNDLNDTYQALFREALGHFRTWLDGLGALFHNHESAYDGKSGLERAISMTAVGGIWLDMETAEVRRPTASELAGYKASLVRPEDAVEAGYEEMDWFTLVRSYRNNVVLANPIRRAFVTTNGYLGVAPAHIRPGDHIVILCGADVPYLLREVENAYEFVGECYLHGIMYGAAWPKDPPITTYDII